MDPRVKPGDDELGSRMAQGKFAILEERGILALSGSDRRLFLQGLVSNDVEKVAADRFRPRPPGQSFGRWIDELYAAR